MPAFLITHDEILADTKCPLCGAGKGEMCVNDEGTPLAILPHLERFFDYRKPVRELEREAARAANDDAEVDLG